MRELTKEQIQKICDYYANAKTYVSCKTIANAFYSLNVTEKDVPKIFKKAIINGIVNLKTVQNMKKRAILNQQLKGISSYKIEQYYNRLIRERNEVEWKECNNFPSDDLNKKIKDEIAYWDNLRSSQGYELDDNGYTPEFIENMIYLLSSKLTSL